MNVGPWLAILVHTARFLLWSRLSSAWWKWEIPGDFWPRKSRRSGDWGGAAMNFVIAARERKLPPLVVACRVANLGSSRLYSTLVSNKYRFEPDHNWTVGKFVLLRTVGFSGSRGEGGSGESGGGGGGGSVDSIKPYPVPKDVNFATLSKRNCYFLPCSRLDKHYDIQNNCKGNNSLRFTRKICVWSGVERRRFAVTTLFKTHKCEIVHPV